jgi:copper chaperone CopZ
VGRRAVSFTVQSIDCIACTPAFRRNLERLPGVLSVKELPITNKIIVEYDDSKLGIEALTSEIRSVSRWAGFGDKVIFHR